MQRATVLMDRDFAILRYDFVLTPGHAHHASEAAE